MLRLAVGMPTRSPIQLRSLTVALLLVCTPACAQWHGGHNENRGHSDWGRHEHDWGGDRFRGYDHDWYPPDYDGGGILGGIIGGVIGSLLRPNPPAQAYVPLK